MIQKWNNHQDDNKITKRDQSGNRRKACANLRKNNGAVEKISNEKEDGQYVYLKTGGCKNNIRYTGRCHDSSYCISSKHRIQRKSTVPAHGRIPHASILCRNTST